MFSIPKSYYNAKEFLEDPQSHTHRGLCFAQLSQRDVIKVLKALTTNCAAERIELVSHSRVLSDAETAELVKLLQASKTLTGLTVDYESISDGNVRKILRGMKKNTAGLTLSSFSNADSVARVVAEEMKGNRAVLYLALNGNFTDAGAESIAELVASSPTLQTLGLFPCDMTDEGKRKIVDAFKGNTRLLMDPYDLEIDSHSLQTQMIQLMERNGKLLRREQPPAAEASKEYGLRIARISEEERETPPASRRSGKKPSSPSLRISRGDGEPSR